MLNDFFYRQRLRLGYSPFYRKFAYRGGFPIQVIDRRGAFDIEHRFFYNRIPKVANSSIISGLLELTGSTEATSSRYKKIFSQPSVLSRKQVDELDGYFKFLFVRSPYTRVLSAYLDKVVRAQYFAPDGKLGRESLARKGGTPSFSEFCNWLEVEGLHRNAHWLPQTDLLLIPLQHFDFIGRFENIDEDFAHVARCIARDPDVILVPRFGPPSTGADQLLDEHYTAADYRKVEHLYADDFDQLGYARR